MRRIGAALRHDAPVVVTKAAGPRARERRRAPGYTRRVSIMLEVPADPIPGPEIAPNPPPTGPEIAPDPTPDVTEPEPIGPDAPSPVPADVPPPADPPAPNPDEPAPEEV